MSSTASRAVACLFALACSGTPTAPAPVADGPNVLLIVWDTTRADHLTPYGYGRDTTPRLQAFAEQAVVYERAVSPGMWTLPSHASLFTGLPVSSHGTNAHHKWLDGRFVTMAESLKSQGYGTYLFSANPYLGDHTNLGQGFDVREFPWSPAWKRKARKATLGKLLPDDASNSLAPLWKQTTYPSGRSNDKVKDAGPVTVEALEAWLDTREDEGSFFAVLNLMEAHIPRIPSLASRRALFDEADVERQLALDQAFPFLLAYSVGLHEYDTEQVATIAQTYDAALRDLDEATGQLFDALEARGILDDTIVVLTADHGEHLGEQHKIGHKYSVYNPLVRVPLLIRYPAKLKPGRVDRVVSTLDIWGTVAELAGLELPESTGSTSLLEAKGTTPAVSELVHATPQALQRLEKVHPGLEWEPWLRTYTAIETADAKCIERNDGTRQLFAMPADPLETTDLAAEDPARTAATCAQIASWRSGVTPYDPALASEDDAPDEMKGELKARLEALGYIDAGAP